MIEKQAFGFAKTGQAVTAYTLTNASGMKIKLIDLGATLVEVWTPDREGNLGNVVLGHTTCEDYETKGGCFGATVGRVANRIAGAEFMLRGKTYHLEANNGKNCCHSGTDAYYRRVWDAQVNEFKNSVTFKLFSPDGDQNFPGNLWMKVTYTLTDEGEVRIKYHAKTDEITLFNPTNHSYFNLSGKTFEETILDHVLWINADQTTPVGEDLVPTGEIRDVAGSPMDFTVPKAVGRDIDADDDQIRFGHGYDHNWMLKAGEAQLICYHPGSGRRLTMTTDMPGVQVYSGGMKRVGICFETQVPPDAVHHDNFPNCILMPDQEFESTTSYRFDVAEEGFWA